MLDQITTSDPIVGRFVVAIESNVVRIARSGLSTDDVALSAAAAVFSPGACSAVLDRTGVYHWVSPGYADAVGVESSALMGSSVFRRFPARWCRERLALIGRSLEDHRCYATVEVFRGRRLEGVVFPVFPPAGAGLAAFIGRFGLALPTPPPFGRVSPCGHGLEPVSLTEADWGPFAGLTRRQLEVLRLIAKGLENGEIAKAIHRTKRAVEWHICNLYEALECPRRTELFRLGLVAGLPDIEESHWAKMMHGLPES